MSRRITFQQFATSLEQRTLPIESLSDYVEFDPTSPIPKLKFKADALLDTVDSEYDVDRKLYLYSRKLREDGREQAEDYRNLAQPSVVAEGDSWFNLPTFLFLVPPAIADWIELNGRFNMRNIADWGHTLRKIYEEREYMDVLKKNSPDFFMFCGGGNDLQEGLACHDYLHRYDPTREHSDYLTENGINGITAIGKMYEEILREVVAEFPHMRILCHGYDFPRPLVGDGKYIGKYLRDLDIPDEEMGKILAPLVNLLNTTIQTAIKTIENVEYKNLRNETSDYTWFDDMHPGKYGFCALAKIFEDTMSRDTMS